MFKHTFGQNKDGCPPYTKDGSEFDHSTFIGRANHFYRIVNPYMMKHSKSSILEAQEFLRKYHLGLLKEKPSDKELWKYKRVVDSGFNHGTGKVVTLPWRMCSFMPMNILIVLGNVNSRSIGSMVFWQSVNQTYNVCVNYANRGSAEKSSVKSIARNYALAMFSAVGSAVGLNLGINYTNLFSPRMKNILLAIVPTFAICFSGFINVATTRLGEVLKGTTVYDKNGDVMGVSKVAGRRAVGLTIISRTLIATTIMGMTPLLYNTALRVPVIRNTPSFHTPLELTCAGSVLLFIVPLALAMFKQKQKISVEKLENNFKDCKMKNGDVPKELYYFKGL